MPNYRVVKQAVAKPNDVEQWAWDVTNVAYVGRLSATETLWEFSGSGAQANANAKAAELSGSDTARSYKVIEIET